jgi:mannose-6-phosphate isomerase-like protein (cupin superfamily)
MQRTYVNPIFKDTVTFLKTVDETNRAYSEYLLTLMPGGGNPPHIHNRFTETFTAVTGNLGLKLGSKTLILQPGETYTVPIGTVHNFFNPGPKEITYRIRFDPGFNGFDHMIRILYGLARDGKTNRQGIPTSLMTTALLCDIGDTQLPGLMKLAAPLFRLLAARARRLGLERQLMATYCPEVRQLELGV